MADTSRTSALIDQIYELLDGIEEDLSALKGESDRRKTELYQVPNIADAVEFLAGFNFENRLGLSQNDLAKFDSYKGTIPAGTLRQLGQRVRSLLKEFEGEVARETPPLPSSGTAATPRQADDVDGGAEPQSFSAQQWVSLPRAANADLLAQLNALLDEVIYLASNTNLPPEERALSDLDRAQIIALLETTLAVLKAPLVEKGLLQRLKGAAEKGANSALEKQSERALGFALSRLGEVIARLLGLLG